ncbi:MAG: OmpA family protein [Chitinophagaceae bacterium]
MTEVQNEQSTTNNGAPLTLLIALLVLVIGAGITLYFWNATAASQKVSSAVIDSPSQKTVNMSNLPLGKLDSAGNFIYELGDSIGIDLPNKYGNLKVGKYSTEAKLITFLQDGYAKIDTINGNWFEFNQVRFKTNSASLEPSSAAQLQNIAIICQAFPKAIFSIGAFTDNTGNENDNLSLSQQKASAIQTILIELGATRSSIRQSKGYGSANPVGDNNTLVGRAQNCRVSINVKSKYDL